MRVEAPWVPLSAAALITGALALMLSTFLSPLSADVDGTAAVLELARDNDGRWVAMSLLWCLSASTFVLGCPAILCAFTKRGRLIGYIGVTLFAIGAIGLAGYAALALVFRAIALNQVSAGTVDKIFDDPGLGIILMVWVVGLYLGLVVIAAALLVARSVPLWVPVLLVVFVAAQVLLNDFQVVQRIGFLALAAGFTGIAIEVAAPIARRESVSGRL